MHSPASIAFIAFIALVACSALACTRLPERTRLEQPRALPAGAVPPGAPAVPFREKTRAERMEFMGLLFYPKMKALFRNHDPERATPFRCQSCHGEDMESVNFKMPNRLDGLPADDPIPAALSRDAKTTQFMTDDVEPAVDELLGVEHVAGRSCGLCHRAD